MVLVFSRARSQRQPSVDAPDGVRGTIRQLAGFVALTYALTLAWLIPMLALGYTVEQGDGWPTHFPALLGPAIAALAMTAIGGGWPATKQLVARMGKWRVGLRWWLFSISPLLVLMATLAVMWAAGQDLPPISEFARFSGLSHGLGVVGVAVAITLLNGFGEEVGWRGYALPRLQRHFAPLPATLLLTVLIAVWHVPYFFVLDTYASMNPGTVVLFAVGLSAGALVFTWLYNATGGSLLAVTVWHGLYNLTGATAAATSGGGVVAASIWTAVVITAVILVIAEVRVHRRGGHSALGPAQIV